MGVGVFLISFAIGSPSMLVVVVIRLTSQNVRCDSAEQG